MLAVSNDGRWVATGDFSDASVCIWKADSGEEVRRLRLAIQGFLVAVAISPDGRHVLTGDSTGSVRWWSVATGEETKRRSVLGGPLLGSAADRIRFSSDGKKLLTCGDREARVLTANGETEIQVFSYEQEASRIAIARHGKTVLTGGREGDARSENGTLKLREVRTRKELSSLAMSGGISFADFLPDGHRALVVDAEAPKLVNLEKSEIVRRFGDQAMKIRRAALAPDGRRFLTCGEDGIGRLWDIDAGTEIRRLALVGAASSEVGFFPDGSPLLFDRTGALHRFDAATGKETVRYEGRGINPEGLALAPDGRSMLIGGSDGAARLWDLATGGIVRQFRTAGKSATAVALSGDGRFAFAGNDRGEVTQWDSSTGKLEAVFSELRRQICSVSVSRDAKRMLAVGVDESAIVWDLGSRERKWNRSPGGLLRVGALTPDGRGVLIGGAFSASAGAIFSLEEGFKAPSIDTSSLMFLLDAVFSSDGRLLALGGASGAAVVFDVATGHETDQFASSKGGSFALAFSPDGKWLARGSDDGSIRWWEIGARGDVREARHRPGKVRALCYSADGKRLISEHWDRTIRIWDAGSGEELATLFSFRDGGWAVTDPDGRFDASNGGDVKELYGVVDADVIPLAQLKARFYEPGLLAKVLGFNKAQLRDVAGPR